MDDSDNPITGKKSCLPGTKPIQLGKFDEKFHIFLNYNTVENGKYLFGGFFTCNTYNLNPLSEPGKHCPKGYTPLLAKSTEQCYIGYCYKEKKSYVNFPVMTLREPPFTVLNEEDQKLIRKN